MNASRIAAAVLAALVLAPTTYAQRVEPRVDVKASLVQGEGVPPVHEPGQMVIPNPSDPSLSLVQPWPLDYATGLYETGTVVIVLTVIPGGYPTDPFVERSSGYFELDSTAQAAVMQWRFHAARAGGKEVSSFVRIPITLSAHYPPPPMVGDGVRRPATMGETAANKPGGAPAAPTDSPPQRAAGVKTSTKVAHALGEVVSFLVATAAGVAEAQAVAPARQAASQTRTPVQRYQAPALAPVTRPVVRTDCTASDFGGTHVSCVSH